MKANGSWESVEEYTEGAGMYVPKSEVSIFLGNKEYRHERAVKFGTKRNLSLSILYLAPCFGTNGYSFLLGFFTGTIGVLQKLE